jgi:hypothetical protein
VRIYRWSAVVVGFVGVVVMLWPYLNVTGLIAAGSTASTVGAACAVTAAFTNAGATIQTRRLTDSETTASIVFYFSLICTFAGLASLPFAWRAPSGAELTALISIGLIGGLSHIFLTESYRYAPASVVAPFDYVALLWAFVFGYVLFGEIPTGYVYPARPCPGAQDSNGMTQRRAFGDEIGASERLERDDRPGVLDARDRLHFLVNEMPDVGALLDVEFHQQVEVAGGRIDFGCDLGIGERIGHRIGFAEVAFDLDEKRDHAHLPVGWRLRPQSSKIAAR